MPLGLDTIEANIFSVQKFSTEDGPGIRTTVFFKGCPMRCPWCHNPEALHSQPELVWHGGRCIGHGACIKVCPEGALEAGPDGIAIDRGRCTSCGECVDQCPTSAFEVHGRRVAVAELFRQAVRDADFYGTSGGGVTLSGGEPLAQPRAALALLRMLHEAEIHTALDTCGGAGEGALREALEVVDLVLLDIKTVDAAKHETITGVSFERVDAAAKLVEASSAAVWIRTPIIPGYTDDEDDVRAVARYVAETIPRCERHDLLAFSNLCASKYVQLDRHFPLESATLLDVATLDRLQQAAREEGSRTARWSGPTRLEKAVQ